MLEVRKGKFARSYENSFFRSLARGLSKSFADTGRTGLLIGSPVCDSDERLQIDALLITEHVVCIIDFKNFSGIINLPSEINFERGDWTTSTGEKIKGGSSPNPFIQLKVQKNRFIDVSQEYIERRLVKGDYFDSSHVVKIVCFQEDINLNGRIPSRESLNFFILHKDDFVQRIEDIIDVIDEEIHISPASWPTFKRVFRADQFNFDESLVDKTLKSIDDTAKLDFTSLTTGQQEAISEIKSFLDNPEKQVFILKGATNSGKSHVIPFIREIAFKTGIEEVELLASSRRVANNLLLNSRFEQVNSLYSYIYGGQQSEREELNQSETETESTDEDADIQQIKVAIKKSVNPDNALFIVDEAQLVSDSLYESQDLVFGSGFLLKDFFQFCDFITSKRKIIFIGDHYKLTMSNGDESPLNEDYLKTKYGLRTSSYNLPDRTDHSAITAHALQCVAAIKEDAFHSLNFIPNSNFNLLNQESTLQAITELVNRNKGHILCYKSEDAQGINTWIKKTILKNGDDLAPDDLILFNKNITIEDEDDPFSIPRKIHNGQFGTVTDVTDKYIEESFTNKKNETTTLRFREISVLIHQSGHRVKVLSLENYRLSPKGLSSYEQLTLKIVLNRYVNQYIDKNSFENSVIWQELEQSGEYKTISTEIHELELKLKNGERVRTALDEKQRERNRLVRNKKKKYRSYVESVLWKTPSSTYYKIRNAVHIKFGWAMTVHKAMSYKWDHVVFNVESGETLSRTNRQYFKWLYSGISTARKTMSLINFKALTPFESTQFLDSSTNAAKPDLFFISENPDVDKRLSELKAFVSEKLAKAQMLIDKTEPLKYQERYQVTNGKDKAIISFGYDGQGRFKMPVQIGNSTPFGTEVVKHLSAKSSTFDFSIVRDNWRKIQYEALSTVLKIENIYFTQIIQNKYKDRIKFHDTTHELEIEVDYSSDGEFRKISAKYYSDPILWETLKESIAYIKTS